MSNKHNTDKVKNYLLTETELSSEERQKLLSTVEKQIEQNSIEQRNTELREHSQRRKAMREMAENNRVINNNKNKMRDGESLMDYANRNRIIK